MSKSRLVDRIGCFTGVPNSFIKTSAARSCAAFRLFVMLRYFTNSETETAFPSFDKLHDTTGLHRRDIAKGLRELEECGWLSRRKRFGKSTIYTLLDPTVSVAEDGRQSAISSSTVGTGISSPVGTSASMCMNKNKNNKKEGVAASPATAPVSPFVISKTKEADKRNHPAIRALRDIHPKKKFPRDEILDLLIARIGENPDPEKLADCRAAWIARGYNPQAFVWATEWYPDGVPKFTRHESKQDRTARILRGYAELDASYGN